MPVIRRMLLVGVLIVVSLALSRESASAHASLERSDPEANAVVAETPESVQLRFAEPLETQYSSAELFDAGGQRVETADSIVGPDPFLLTLPLPDDLAAGTYSVQWRNVSSTDGHPAAGYIPFTIGTASDVVATLPPAQVDFGGPPVGVNAVGRWLSLLGVAGAVGALMTWFVVICRARQPLGPEHQALVGQRVRMVALVSLGVALVGSFISLGVQVSTVGSVFSVLDIWEGIHATRFGLLWSIRVALLLALGSVLYPSRVWQDTATPLKWVGAGLAVAVLAPFSLNSHAAAPGRGRAAAMVADWVHLGAASIWIGGLLAVLSGVVYATRGAPRKKRLATYALVVPRFSTLAIASVVILSLTGFYAAWLQVGSLIALQETSYGQTLAIKLGITLLMLALGAVNLFVIAPRLRRAAVSSINFGRTVAAEVVLGVLVLFMVGLLTSLPTARTSLTAEAGRLVFHLADQGAHLSLYLSPGTVGANRYTADFDLAPEDIPEGSQVLLRTTPMADLEGIREVTLVQAEPGRFEASGSELSVVGGWQLEVILRRPGETDLRATTETIIRDTPPDSQAPAPAPMFPGLAGVVWVLVLSGALVVFVVGMRGSRRRGLAGFGVVLICLSLGGLVLSRETPSPDASADNPAPITPESVATGP